MDATFTESSLFVEVSFERREPDVIVFATKRDGLAHIYETYLKREGPALEALGYIAGSAERSASHL